SAAAPAASAVAASPTSAATTTALFTRTGFIDGEGPSAIGGAVQGADCGLGFIVVGHLDEAETAAAPAKFVDDHLAARDGPVLLEQLLQIIAGGVVGEVTDIDVLRHDLSLVPKTGPFAPPTWQLQRRRGSNGERACRRSVHAGESGRHALRHHIL